MLLFKQKRISVMRLLKDSRATRSWIGVIGLMVMAGCGSNTVDVRPRVLLDGQPLKGASVTLHGHGPTASGLTDADGVVQFTTFERNDGVQPGTYKVVIFKSPQDEAEEWANLDMDDDDAVLQMAQRSRGVRPTYTPTVLPRLYISLETTPLTLTVPPAEEEIVFDLDSSLSKKRGKKSR